MCLTLKVLVKKEDYINWYCNKDEYFKYCLQSIVIVESILINKLNVLKVIDAGGLYPNVLHYYIFNKNFQYEFYLEDVDNYINKEFISIINTFNLLLIQ